MCRGGEVTQDIELFCSFAYGPFEDPAPAHEVDYFLGLDTAFATSTFLSSDLEPFPSLAGQSGNLILPARVPAGREIVIARDCTMDIRFGWNPCSCSTTNGSVRPATVVELPGAFGPPPTGGQTLPTFEAPSGSAPPERGNVLIQYSAEVAAGFRFSGTWYTIPIDQVAATFPTIGPLAGPSESTDSMRPNTTGRSAGDGRRSRRGGYPVAGTHRPHPGSALAGCRSSDRHLCHIPARARGRYRRLPRVERNRGGRGRKRRNTGSFRFLR